MFVKIYNCFVFLIQDKIRHHHQFNLYQNDLKMEKEDYRIETKDQPEKKLFCSC